MNLTDLSAELESRADHLNTGAAMARLAGVRSRVRTRRRRQAGAAALIAAGCVLAVVLGPNLSVLRADRSSEPASTQHHVKPYTFDDVLAGDPLLASAVGTKGQNEVVLRFTPADNYLELAAFCRAPKDQADQAGTTTVNGHGFLRGGCGDSSVANDALGSPGDSAAENRAGWAAMGVVPGRESVIRIRLETSKHVLLSDPSVRLGIGVYAMTGERITSNGVVLKLDAEADGHDYRLANYLTRPVSKGVRQLRLPVPAGRWPVYVIGGVGGKIDDKDARATADVGVVGKGPNSYSDGGGVMSVTLDDARAQTVQVHTTGSSGVLLLAYYVRVD